MLQIHHFRLGDGVVRPHHFYGGAVAGPFFIDYHYAVGRLLFCAETRQTNHQHRSSNSIFYIVLLSFCPSPMGSLSFPSRLPRNPPPEKLFIILRICAYCRSRLFTSCTDCLLYTSPSPR